MAGTEVLVLIGTWVLNFPKLLIAHTFNLITVMPYFWYILHVLCIVYISDKYFQKYLYLLLEFFSHVLVPAIKLTQLNIG